jgi:cytochrome c oxidase subunit 1
LVTVSSFLTPGGASDFGWYAYSPLTNAANSPGAGADLWIMGLAVAGLGTILGAVNMVTTVIALRAPGMTLFRMPIFTWNILVTSMLVLLAFPLLTAALLVLWVDRHMGAQVFDPANGGAIPWQHLFWYFGHPEVYIVAIPFFGIVTEVIPVFSRKPVFGYKGMVLATLSIAALSLTVWAHHMFTTGAVLLPFFSLMSFLIAVPTGIKFFNWIGTMWGGAITFETPMLFAVGFMVTFLFGGLTGVLLASPAIDFHVADTSFLVAHFHYVLFGTIVFAAYSGIYFWFPKFTGRYLDERLGKLHFWDPRHRPGAAHHDDRAAGLGGYGHAHRAENNRSDRAQPARGQHDCRRGAREAEQQGDRVPVHPCRAGLKVRRSRGRSSNRARHKLL